MAKELKMYNVAYSTKSGKGYVARIKAISQIQARKTLINQMKESSSFKRIISVF